MPEIFLEFIGDASPWLVPLLVVLAVWGKFNWAALNNPDKKASFERAVGWLRDDSFGQLYLGFLGGVMDRVGGWIGDRQQLSQASMVMTPAKGPVQRLFGFNPFTAESYEKCLWLAFLYPVLAYLLAWAVGAEGQVGNISLFLNEDMPTDKNTQLTSWQRLSIIGAAMLLALTSLWLTQQLQGKKQWLMIVGFILLATLASSFRIISDFLIFFIPMYIGGWFAGLIQHRSIKKAHQEKNIHVLRTWF